MQVVLHLGAHMTDEDRLVASLVKNRKLLADNGIEVPGPGRYRKAVRRLLRAAARSDPAPDARDTVLEAAGLTEEPTRLILSAPSFLGTPKMAAGGGMLYAATEARLGFFHQIFGQDQLELFFAVKNLATFLPGMLGATNFETMDDFLRGVPADEMRWSEMIRRVRSSFPDLPVTIWCNEDTPLIWADIMRAMTGLGRDEELEGEFDLLGEIMSAPGLKRFRDYVSAHPGMTELQKRRVVVAFLDKFAEASAIEEELDVPGWTDALVDRLTALYDEDVAEIQGMPGVRMIMP